uniref:DUF4211 domain-containing protein n=1 Tax=Globodera rostochiensis TaxID=31243 RepID=A0A914HBY7_GLORO
MDSNDMRHHQGTHSNSGTVDGGALSNPTGNNDLLFSTLRHLATRNSESSVAPTNGLYNETTSYPSFQVSLSDQSTSTNYCSSNAVGTSSSSAWLDQAKLSLLPMYGMFQSSLNSSEIYRNSNLSWMDSNIKQAAAAAVAFNAAASLNAMQNLPSFGHLSSASVGFSNLNVSASSSHTPQPTGGGHSTQSQTIAQSSAEGQSASKSAECSNYRANPAVPSSMEELSELDLHDFEDFFMEKPSTSLQATQSHRIPFFASIELEKTTGDNNNQPPLHYRTDELASADIELDRLVSLVASQNSCGTGTQPPAKEFTRSNKKESISKSNFLSGPPIFELPQFTPPESPTEIAQLLSVGADNETKHSEPPIDNLKHASNVLVNHCVSNHVEISKSVKENPERRSAAEGNLVFIPKEIKCETAIQQFSRNKVSLTRRDTSKVPVYKLSAYSLNKNCSLDQPQLDDQKRIDDAYSFEEDELPIASCSLSEVLHGAICLSQGREHKLAKEEDHQTKTKRKYTKLHSSSEEVPHEKAVEKINAVYSILAERAKRKATRACFVSSELATDDHSVLTDIPIPTCTLRNGNSNEDVCPNASTTPLLPKLIIRLPKKENSANDDHVTLKPKHSSHKEKKRKKKNKDVDWSETMEFHGTKQKDKRHKEKRHKKWHHKRRRHSTEADESVLVLSCSVPMQQSNFDVPEQQQSNVSPPSRNEPENAEFFTRLHLFERPTERPRRGTFLLPKEDLFAADCALWRIDNQNLLQKYLPVVLDGVTCYQNSSTYSGWCEHYVDDYIAIRVEYIKQSRSENVVCPTFPLQDLFPATNFFADGEEGLEHRTLSVDFEEGHLGSNDEQFDGHLNTFVKLMLKHAVSLQFIQHIRQNDDFGYLYALNEIESRINRCIKNIRMEAPFWSSKFVDCLQLYPRINAVKRSDDNCSERCQACSSCDQEVESAIQLFSLEEQYDYETLSSFTASGIGAISPSNLATDFYVCAQCELYALSYHKAYHLCFYVLKNAEEKLEQVSAKYADLSADELIEKCLGDKIWLNKIADTVMCVSKDGIKDKKLFLKQLPID